LLVEDGWFFMKDTKDTKDTTGAVSRRDRAIPFIDNKALRAEGGAPASSCSLRIPLCPS